MPTYEKRSGSWRVSVMREGTRHRATFTTKAEAEFWAEGLVRGSSGKVTLSDALKRYSAEVSTTKRGARWEQIRIEAFLRIVPFVDKPIERVSSGDLADWRDTRLKQVSAGTVGRELSVLSAVFQWAKIERKWIASNPVHDIAWPAKPKPRKRRVSPDDTKAILKALGYKSGPPQHIHHEIAIAFLLALETAMRCGELLSLSPEQVFLKRRFVHLDKTKNGDERDVPLSKEAVRLFKLIPKGFTIRGGSFDVLFRRARDRAGLPDLHFHDTRREAATRLSKKLDPMELAKMTGHRDLSLLMRVYYAPDASEAAKKLD